MPWNSFLEEHWHGPHIVRFFLEYFSKELLLVPATIQLVTHSRFDRGVQDPGTESVIEPATTHVELIPPEQDEQWDLDLHLYNDTGFGARGLHFSPVLGMPLPTFEWRQGVGSTSGPDCGCPCEGSLLAFAKQTHQ